MSDNFALVPRAHSDNFFSAIEAYYTCNDDDSGTSWPPGEAWWQPDCGGSGDSRNDHSNDGHNFRDSSGDRGSPSNGGGSAESFGKSRRWDDGDERCQESRGGAERFEGSILYRHLHAKKVPHRPYPMFEYFSMKPHGGGDHGRGRGDGDGGARGRSDRETRISCETGTANYATVCLLLSTAGLLRAGYLRWAQDEACLIEIRCACWANEFCREEHTPPKFLLQSRLPPQCPHR